MFSVEKIKVAPEMDEFFEEQTLRNESAGWLRNELLGVGDICILCDDVHDGNGLASLELLSALRQRVLRYDESSEGDSDMEIVVRCVYLKDNGAGFLVRLSYRKLERRYKLEMYVTSTAMRMGGELMEEFAKVISDRGGGNYTLVLDAQDYQARASNSGNGALTQFNKNTYLPQRLLLLLQEERRRVGNTRNVKLEVYALSDQDMCDIAKCTLELDPTKPFSANPCRFRLQTLYNGNRGKAPRFLEMCVEYNAYFSISNGDLVLSSHCPFVLDLHGCVVPIDTEHPFIDNLNPIIKSVAKLHRDKTMCNMLRRVCSSTRHLGRGSIQELGETRSVGAFSQDIYQHVLRLELASCISIVKNQARLAIDHLAHAHITEEVVVID